MAQTPVTVVALFNAKPEKLKEARGALEALLEPTRQEQGCINYDLHQNSDDPCLFLFYENWATQADLDNHAKSTHLEILRGQVKELFTEPVDLTLWKQI